MVFGAKFLDFHHCRCMGRIELPFSTGHVSRSKSYQQNWPTKRCRKMKALKCVVKNSRICLILNYISRCFFRGFSLILCGDAFARHHRPGLTRRSELPRVGETHGGQPWDGHSIGLPMAVRFFCDYMGVS